MVPNELNFNEIDNSFEEIHLNHFLDTLDKVIESPTYKLIKKDKFLKQVILKSDNYILKDYSKNTP